MGRVIEGIDRFLQESSRWTGSSKVGILAHAASCDARLIHLVDGAIDAGVHVSRIFGPEHGLFGAAQDMEGVGGMTYRGVPVESLYGDSFDTLSPQVAHLSGLDCLVIDLRDVGARYYTYVWTAFMATREALKAGCRVLLLDRVNPIRGDITEGNLQEEGYCSFVGLLSVPVRHGLTCGELVSWALKHQGISSDGFEVITLAGWERGMWFDHTELPWIMPSPNMPTLETAVVYPGMCLIEGTNLSEGRGTTRPFELFGAPYVDGSVLTVEMGEIPGALLRPVMFKPTFQKWAGKACGGVQLHVTDRDVFRSWEFALQLVHKIVALWPEQFAWREKAYEFVEEIPAFDLLCGSSAHRECIERGDDLTSLFADATQQTAPWFTSIDDVLLY